MTLSSEKTRVLVVGAGAIGSFYGALLAERGADVSVVCRSDFDAIKSHGFDIDSPSLGQMHFTPAQVLQHTADYQGGWPDYLILSVKVVHGVDRAAMIKDAVGPDTTIVLIENGVEIEAEIAAAFPDNELISALAYVQISRVAPGKVKHHALGDLTFGTYPSGISSRCELLASLLERDGIKMTLTDNVVKGRWHKCVWNAVFNPISVLGGVLDTASILGPDEGKALVKKAMLEVIEVAAATDNPLPVAMVDQFIERTKNGPAYKTSMALDFENGRPMEVEVILGNVVRAGRREQVSMPVLEAIYALMKMIDARDTAK
ncbi:2-dehydropantoate 2-reductase [Undibacterium sp. GrIS 1.8]|uniref:ketopantoate reductase family protein n=1 Tax=unclassified Undibacterium TaxID=2630295 RepID=UPI0033922300